MAKKKLREEFEAGDLNLLPIMNLICLLIPFLLMAAQFIKIGVILVETPRLSKARSTQNKDKKKALNLRIDMTVRGFKIKTSRSDRECPPGASSRGVCIPVNAKGEYDAKVFQKLQEWLWYLQREKYKEDWLPSEWHHVTVAVEPTIKYENIIAVLDAIRDIPQGNRYGAAAKPRPPKGGCHLKYQKKGKDSGTWQVQLRGDKKVRDACMFHRVTLAMGTS